MQSQFSDVWAIIEHALACIKKADRARTEAYALCARSEQLRQDSARLLASNPRTRREREARKRLSQRPVLVQQFRLFRNASDH